MKQFNILLTMLMVVFVNGLFAQSVRYIDPIFQRKDIVVTRNVVYGANYTILTVLQGRKPALQPLVMDVYEPPTSDANKKRPLVLYFHTGNFLPQPSFCSIQGNRDDSTCVEFATQLAQRGYVCAVVDYRLGWNPISTDLQTRRSTLIQAAYRGIQDARTCARYFRRDAANTNTFGIDTTKFALWGQGTGGYIAVNTAALDNYALDIASKTKFRNPTTSLPYVVTSFPGGPFPDVDGNPDGTSLGRAPQDVPGTPIKAGDTLCRPNWPGYNSTFQLSVNMGGALADTSWLDPSDPPMIGFHAPLDPNAPYDVAELIVPTTGNKIIEVFGSRGILANAVPKGINNIFNSVNWNDPYTAAAKASKNENLEGLFPLWRPVWKLPNTTATFPESDPWSFWEPTRFNQAKDTCSLDNDNNPATPKIPLHQQSIVSNQDMSAAKARRYIDSIFNYALPRACLALNLGCDLSRYTTVSTRDLPVDAGLTVFPVPAAESVVFNASKMPIQGIQVFDIAGKLVTQFRDINQYQFSIDRQSLKPGIYLARVQFEGGVLTEKIVFE